MDFDKATWKSLLAGEKRAWDRFVTRWAPLIYAAVLRKLTPAGRADDAEDVAQQVFVRLCRNDRRLLATYDPTRAKLSTWLTIVSHSTAIDHLRREKLPSAALEAAPVEALTVHQPSLERVTIPPGLLSERQRLVIELLYRHDKDPAEVAEILGIEAQTVRSTHHKALTKLREHFSRQETG